MKRPSPFASEAELVAAFCEYVERAYNQNDRRSSFTFYHETAGWDLLLVEQETGIQIGIEAKMSLNAKVIVQALEGDDSRHFFGRSGPDYRAVLVPNGSSVQQCFPSICRRLGLAVIVVYDQHERGWDRSGKPHVPHWAITGTGHGLPDENSFYGNDWHSWLPDERIKLPDYVPDVQGGKVSPVALTDWKIRAIKLFVLLDRQGFVTRANMKALGLSPTRFTDSYNGFLATDKARGGYVRHDQSPDLRGQHPVNYAEIEADWEKWGPEVFPGLFVGVPV
jgi:hypothetical protein